MAIYFATQIVSHGWLRFLQQRGAEQGQMMGFALQALPCSDKLVERLLGTGDKYVPEPANVPEPEPEPDAEHTTPRFFMDGPGEEC
jgi:hypothetical protein